MPDGNRILTPCKIADTVSLTPVVRWDLADLPEGDFLQSAMHVGLTRNGSSLVSVASGQGFALSFKKPAAANGVTYDIMFRMKPGRPGGK